ncbi:MAG: hypothetical protein M1395_00765, partial [Bacteroidetes bacterium]|nr:hypothetical protein [Bacteroidota bacterium]
VVWREARHSLGLGSRAARLPPPKRLRAGRREGTIIPRSGISARPQFAHLFFPFLIYSSPTGEVVGSE